MTTEELQKLERWEATLQEVSEVYIGNINLNTVIGSIKARIKETKKN